MSMEAMKLALETLDVIHRGNLSPLAAQHWDSAIYIIRQTIQKEETKREPLTDEQIEFLWANFCKKWKKGPQQKIIINCVEFARAIEAAHGIKENT
jgi:peptidyl-tRNA hydrolase